VISAPALTVAIADYTNSRDAHDLVEMLDIYARDPMGGGKPLSEHVRERLVPGLAATPGAFSLLARLEDKAVGLANCMTTYSTFAAAPLVNIHDVVATRLPKAFTHR